MLCKNTDFSMNMARTCVTFAPIYFTCFVAPVIPVFCPSISLCTSYTSIAPLPAHLLAFTAFPNGSHVVIQP